jgi:cell fate regulator YaaT (PSP1 superfamily)
MKQLVKVNVTTGISYECIAEDDISPALGDKVVVRCERYLDFGAICSVSDEPIEDESSFEKRRAQLSKGRHIEGQKIPRVLRLATAEDEAQAADNDARALDAHHKTQERIRAHKLDMKLIHTHYAFDRKLLLFQFSAEGRVDFRELLRDLSSLFRIRVELRQVGVRDEAAILGGIGSCGRPFCCASFLPSFNSINVKMAKQQGLSLNPQNISGVCGRLKCCLQYEAECYRQAAAELKAKQQQQQAADKSASQESGEGQQPAQPQQQPAAGQAPGQGGRAPRRGEGGRGGRGGRGGQRRQRSASLPPRNPNKAPLPPAEPAGDAGQSKPPTASSTLSEKDG